MRRHVHVVTAAILLATSALAGCTGADISKDDVYKIGCPAVDTVAGGGSLAGKATVFGLEKLRDSGQLGPEATQWVNAAIGLLNGAKPEDLPADARRTIVDGCAKNGYPLRNLR